jgi:hypothetical protein
MDNPCPRKGLISAFKQVISVKLRKISKKLHQKPSKTIQNVNFSKNVWEFHA